MADNKNIRDGRDRSRVDGNENYELSHVQKKMNASREEVKDAISKAGNNREKVEQRLKDNGK